MKAIILLAGTMVAALLARVLLSLSLVGGAATLTFASGFDVQRIGADLLGGFARVAGGIQPRSRHETVSVLDTSEVAKRQDVRRRITAAGSLILTIGD